MAYRDRSCGHLQPRKVPMMPPPQQLARLQGVMHILMECANEYEAVSDDGEWTPAPEFVTWLDVEVQRSAVFGKASAVRVDAPPLRLHSSSKKVAASAAAKVAR